MIFGAGAVQASHAAVLPSGSFRQQPVPNHGRGIPSGSKTTPEKGTEEEIKFKKSAWKQMLQLGVTVTSETVLCLQPLLPGSRSHPAHAPRAAPGRVWGSAGILSIPEKQQRAAPTLRLCLLLTFPSALWLLQALFFFFF